MRNKLGKISIWNLDFLCLSPGIRFILYEKQTGKKSKSLAKENKFYLIKPSLHNTIDNFILQLVTSSTCFGVAWPSSGLQRLVSIKVHNNTKLCKPDDGQARPKHVADITSCRIQLSVVLCKDGVIQ